MRNTNRILLLLAFLTGSLLAALAQAPEAPTAPVPAATPEESTLALLKAMFFQVLKSPASLLVILGLSIATASVEFFIRATNWISNRMIVPSVLLICVLGGAASYWLFSSTASVDKQFPHPHAVLAVNGIVCGFAAFFLHLVLGKYILNKTNPPPN